MAAMHLRRMETTAARVLLVLSCVASCGVLSAGCADSAHECPAPKGQVCTLAGTGELGFNRDGLPPTQSDLYLVSAARRGPDSLLYVMDFNNQRVRVIDEDDRMQTVIGSGFHALAAAGEPATDSPLENPIDFDFLSDGRLVFTSYHDPRVIVWDDDDTLQVLAGTGEVGVDGDEGDGGPALAAEFVQLDGIAIDDEDAIYVSDSLAHRVRVIRDGEVETVAGTGSAGYSGDGGPATEAELHWPTALTFDEGGRLLIADTRNHVVRRLQDDGSIETIAGTGKQGSRGDGGPALEARFNQPNGLAVDSDGTLYVSDRGNFCVRAIDAEGEVSTVAGTGEEGMKGDGVSALKATFGYLARIALDDDGLLIADQSGSLVRRVTLR